MVGIRIAAPGIAEMPPGMAADDIVRLARGEHLGARHDAALEALAASASARDAFRLARAIEHDAKALAVAIAAARGTNVAVMERKVRQVATPARWAAAAAVGFVAAGAMLFGLQGPVTPIAVASPEADLIFVPSDDALASSSTQPSGDALFVDAFGG